MKINEQWTMNNHHGHMQVWLTVNGTCSICKWDTSTSFDVSSIPHSLDHVLPTSDKSHSCCRHWCRYRCLCLPTSLERIRSVSTFYANGVPLMLTFCFPSETHGTWMRPGDEDKLKKIEGTQKSNSSGSSNSNVWSSSRSKEKKESHKLFISLKCLNIYCKTTIVYAKGWVFTQFQCRMGGWL